MKEEQKRYGKAFLMAIVVHIVLCMAIAVLGFTFNKHTPQVLEVTLAGDIPPKLGSLETVKVEQPMEKKQVIIPEEDDIVEEQKDVLTEPQSQQKVSAPAKPGVEHGHEQGKEKGTGNNHNASGNGKGDKIGVPATPPRILASFEPAYPVKARGSNIEGTTYVKVLVDVKGKVEEAFLAASSGSSLLDTAAVKALYKWNFIAAKDAYGQPCPCYITIPIKFSLR